MTTTKNYIGKGKQVQNIDIIKVNIRFEEIAAIVYEKNGKSYVSFEIAKLKETDQFGNTHTCYFTTKVEETPAKKKK
ncbi:MAG: hypothetical protein NTZ33_06320 [Bacteroidetes bacterium]|nr:hypothetical protein [Bacteroidota bacterium]